MNKPHWFFEEVYRENIYFCPGYTLDEMNAMIKANFNLTCEPPLKLAGHGACIEVKNDEGNHAIIVWLENNKTSGSMLTALAHECVHAKNIIFRDRGIENDMHNDEPEAYLVGYLFRKMIGWMDDNEQT